MGNTPWYATREDLQASLRIAEQARVNARTEDPAPAEPARSVRQLDDALAAGSRAVDTLCRRTFYPWTGTRTFDWPTPDGGANWRLWFGEHDLAAATAVTTSNGTVTIAPGGYLLRPDHGPPYTHLELLRSGSAVFGGGSTPQRDISITGLWAYQPGTATVGALAAAVTDTTSTTVTVTDASTIGVGDLLTVDTERLLVTGRSWATTGQTVAGVGLTAFTGDQALTVASGSAINPGEVLLVDAERLYVQDIVGNTIWVQRAWDDTLLTEHLTGVTIYAARTITVERAATGSTAATHSNGTTLTRHVYPALVRQLALAEALAGLVKARSAYAGTASVEARRADWTGLEDLRDRVYSAHGRKARTAAI